MIQDLKNRTRLTLEEASYDPKRLAFVYSGITMGASLLAVLVDWLSGFFLQNTTGFSGMKARALWDTATTVLSLASQILMPLLLFGFIHCTILLSRKEQVTPRTLMVGLRRCFTIFWMALLHGLFYFFLFYLVVQVVSIFYSFLPGAQKSMEAAYAILQDPAVMAGNPTPAQLFALLDSMKVVLILSGVLGLAVLIPVSYRLRMSRFLIMDQTPRGAMYATALSFRMMTRRSWLLFRLDLSFWWYHLAKLVLSGVFFLAGFYLTGGWYILGCLVYTGVFIALEYRYLAYVQTTYALFYDDLFKAAGIPKLPQ